MDPRSEEERRRRGGRAAPPDGWGIVPAYEDAFGNWTEVPAETRDRLVVAMGGDPAADGPPTTGDEVLVVRTGDTPEIADAVEIALEDGEVVAVDGRLPPDLPPGYHDLRLRGRADPGRLIVGPGAARLPPPDVHWGWAAQVYALRSAASWGIGDLGDLRALADWSASVGAGTLLINPLNASSPTHPRVTSPYYPTSRRFLDPLYLRVDDLPGAVEVAGLEGLADAARRGGGELIDRDAVWSAKREAFERIWREVPAVRDDPAFVDRLRSADPSLRRFAAYCALAERYGPAWRGWPTGHAHPDDVEVVRFTADNDDRVRFHLWLQWQCEVQLTRASEPVALLGDLPIGADPDGFDAWEWQAVLADGVSVGAPPDELGPHGQNWMLPAFVPWKLRAARFEPFVTLLRAAMRHVAGLRIDHVLGLFRMFWIPADGHASDGTYVRMPAGELLDILALESLRNDTFVVGEDLGTVEEGVRDTLDERDILRYQVWWFEEDPLETWSPKALASVSTHDLPTVAGVWTGADEEELRTIGQAPDGAWHAGLRRRIAAAGGVDEDASVEDAIVGLHRHVARAPNRIVVAQLDDALAVRNRINVPGTERPENWSRPLPVPVEDLPAAPTVQAVVAAMRDGRKDRVAPARDPDTGEDRP
jgi:4-alpha-glucanotransferase